MLSFAFWHMSVRLHSAFSNVHRSDRTGNCLSTSLQNSSRRLHQLGRIGDSKNCRNCRWLKLMPAILTVTFVLVVLKMFLTQTACGRWLPFITSAVYEPTLSPFHVFRKSEQSKSVLRFILTVRGTAANHYHRAICKRKLYTILQSSCSDKK